MGCAQVRPELLLIAVSIVAATAEDRMSRVRHRKPVATFAALSVLAFRCAG
jgi:hypothetical protein